MALRIRSRINANFVKIGYKMISEKNKLTNIIFREYIVSDLRFFSFLAFVTETT